MKVKGCINGSCVCGVFGIFLIGFGTICAILMDNMFDWFLARSMKLQPNSTVFEKWKNPPIKLSTDIYLFNWTNPTPFTEEEYVRPIFKEIGPYRYTELMEKVDITWNDENSTISYHKKSEFYFDADGSTGKMDDIITTLNILALGAGASVAKSGYVKQKGISITLSVFNQKGYVTKTADELIFGGYENPLLEVAKTFSGDFDMDRFALMRVRNGSEKFSGFYNMHTGASDFSKIGSVPNWNYHNHTGFYPGSCGAVKGNAGDFNSFKRQKTDPLMLFTSELCRSLLLDFDQEVELNGIKGYKYSGGAHTMDNGTQFPDMSCFSVGEILPSGVMNASACRANSPTFMSFPHFYGADPYYLQQVEGLKPEKDKHEFYFTLEPRTGIQLDVAGRFQFNMLVRPIPNVALYEEAPFLVFPIMWIENRFTAQGDISRGIWILLRLPLAGYVICGLCIIIGIVFVTRWFGFTVTSRRKGGKEVCSGKKLNGKDVKVRAEGSPLMTKVVF